MLNAVKFGDSMIIGVTRLFMQHMHKSGATNTPESTILGRFKLANFLSCQWYKNVERHEKENRHKIIFIAIVNQYQSLLVCLFSWVSVLAISHALGLWPYSTCWSEAR